MSTLTAPEHEALRLFKQKLVVAFPGRLEELKLFGSKARGDAGADSDVDVLVVLRTGSGQDELRICDLAAETLAARGWISPRRPTRGLRSPRNAAGGTCSSSP